MNKEQFTYEILESYRIPFKYSLPGSPDHSQTIKNRLNAHDPVELTNSYCETCELRRMDWPPSSLDLNLIQNVLPILKTRVRRRFYNAIRMQYTRQKLVTIAQEEWEKLDWKVLDRMILGK